jgi:hypothetical protein
LNDDAYGIDIKLAGSLSLAVSLPTMLVAFAATATTRRSPSYGGSGWFVLAMTAGSILGTVLGALLGVVPNLLLIPALALLLLLSAVKLWRH